MFTAVSSVHAADLPARKAPPIDAAPAPLSWNGLYVGLNAGGTWSASNRVTVLGTDLYDDPFWAGGSAAALSATGTIPTSGTSGFLGGGQIGYNLQFYSHFLAGIEADFQGVASGSGGGQALGLATNPLFVGFVNPVFATATHAQMGLDYLGTVRGRLGYLATPSLLVYASGGFAYGGATLSAQQFTFDGSGLINPGFGGTSYSNTRFGWTVGAGVEWMFAPNWSVKAEYLYYDLGGANTTFGPVVGTNIALFTPTPVGGPIWAYATSVSSRFDGHIVRAGVNYHFNFGAASPIVAKF